MTPFASHQLPRSMCGRWPALADMPDKAATLDGVVESSEAVFEAKFMLPWAFSSKPFGRST